MIVEHKIFNSLGFIKFNSNKVCDCCKNKKKIMYPNMKVCKNCINYHNINKQKETEAEKETEKEAKAEAEKETEKKYPIDNFCIKCFEKNDISINYNDIDFIKSCCSICKTINTTCIIIL